MSGERDNSPATRFVAGDIVEYQPKALSTRDFDHLTGQLGIIKGPCKFVDYGNGPEEAGYPVRWLFSEDLSNDSYIAYWWKLLKKVGHIDE